MTALTAAEAVHIARTQINTTESPAGSNRTKYGEWYGWNGVAWCAIFVSWVVVGRCGIKLPGSTTAKGFSSCAAIKSAAQAQGRWYARAYLRRGDLVLFQMDSDAAPDHVEMFDRWTDASKAVAITVGGNTSADDHGSQSNGGGVYERKRRASTIMGGYRPPYAAHRVLYLHDPMLKGPDVAEVAHALETRHYGCGLPVDVFGPQMDRAVRAFQKARGRTVNGRVDATIRHDLGLPA